VSRAPRPARIGHDEGAGQRQPRRRSKRENLKLAKTDDVPAGGTVRPRCLGGLDRWPRPAFPQGPHAGTHSACAARSPGWQIDESDDLAPGRVLVSDAGCWMVGQVFSSESGFRR
jgi:hypothetical protein